MLYIKQIFVFACITTIFACSSTYRTSTVHIRTIDSSLILQTPVVCELEVSDRKITGNFTGRNVSVEYAKNMAVNNALFNGNGDVLVEPTFDVTVTGVQVTVDVNGFVGKYKNFRRPTVDTTGYVKVVKK